MKILLARIDDRFIHGQVTVGWSQKLRPDRIILANNEIAADEWQSRVYRSSVPPEIRVSILSASQTVADLTGGGHPGGEGEAGILLTGNPQDMLFVHRHGVPLAEVNVGGMHYQAGKQEMLPFVYVDRQDLAAFRSLVDSGARLSAQQVPGGRETVVDLDLIRALEEQL